jgi:hypothetical protein
MAASSAQATILQGSSTGTFADFICTPSCPQSSDTSTTITLGTNGDGGPGSVLSIITPFNIGPVNGTLAGVDLAELTLTVGNKPGAGQGTLSFDYNLVLTFTTPAGAASQTFTASLNGNGGSGSSGDVYISGLDLTLSDPLVLPGVTLSNFRFAADSSSSFSSLTGTWTASKGGTYDLFLLADVTSTSSDAAAIPEPGSLALLGGGLLGLVFWRRRLKAG